jgi:hypothetical protein
MVSFVTASEVCRGCLSDAYAYANCVDLFRHYLVLSQSGEASCWLWL